jgi:hypothetical protein
VIQRLVFDRDKFDKPARECVYWERRGAIPLRHPQFDSLMIVMIIKASFRECTAQDPLAAVSGMARRTAWKHARGENPLKARGSIQLKGQTR